MTHRLLWVSAAALAGCLTPPSLSDETTVSDPVRPAAAPQTWRPLTNAAPFSGAGAPLLYQDGTVWVQEYGTENWWRLTPDNMGDYGNGTWDKMPSMPAGYSPLYNASAVLPDGKIIIEGGEYLALSAVWTTRGAIYDPATNAWTAVAPPAGWGTIGDASGLVLSDGTFMLTSCCDQGAPMALFNVTTKTWTPVGSGKQDIHDEESWALLPDDTILTADANNTGKLTESEIYDPKAKMWHSAGSTVVQLSDLTAGGGGSHEQGPLMLRPDGIVIGIGASGHTATYDTHTKTWTQGPDLPKVGAKQLTSCDGPGAMLPSGKVLLALAPGPPTDACFTADTHVFEFDGTTFTEVPATPHGPTNASYQNFMLMLPTGEVLMTDNSNDIEIYTPSAGVAAEAIPVITSAPKLISASDPDPITPDRASVVVEALPSDPFTADLLPVATISPGRSYKLGGIQLNGLSQGASYGDDQQSSTSFPLVRLTSMASSHVLYARTFESSSYSIAPGLESTTKFDVPMTAERGLATMQIVANGIASPPVVVNVK